MNFEVRKEHKQFGGKVVFASHHSKETKTKMNFSFFTPAKPAKNAIIWLSGLTCTDENFITKAGAQEFLKDTETMIICPDTSPRELELTNEHENYDFGSGAGFYINATTEGYKDHYNMYGYIKNEIVKILNEEFKVDKISIMGHSMGGHGALVLGLRENFASVSAFSPIVNPVNCSWGQKAFAGYLGEDKSLWKEYDTCELILSGKKAQSALYVDQGTSDEFLEKELLTKNLEEACQAKNHALTLNMREGYDHSYYFISTFIEDHIKFHLDHLSK